LGGIRGKAARVRPARLALERAPGESMQVRARRRDWGALLESARKARGGVSAFPEAALPTGLHDGHVFRGPLRSPRSVTGLVVSIGVSAAAEPRVREFITTLLAPGDFAATSAPGEFLLLFPEERGASAQRRLARIGQQLWDFQVESLGHGAVFF